MSNEVGFGGSQYAYNSTLTGEGSVMLPLTVVPLNRW